MLKIAVLLALVAAATAEPVSRFNPLSPNGRIVGGVATSIDLVPYQVSLQLFGSLNCGGSIISANWILSAAHCLSWPASWYTIRSGSTLSNSGGTLTSVARVINHENYRTTSMGVPLDDIALIQLNTPLVWSSTQAPIALYAAGQEAVAGDAATISGWGRLSEGGSLPTVLQTVTVPIVSKAVCDAAYVSFGGLPADQICAGVIEGGMGACNGDSGGPLTINGVLAGVVSWSLGCTRPGYPCVYSEVAGYRAWITANSGV